ncbi:MAG: S1 RNA-binding domain-containing protein [Ardenticatenaceae bacterium]|nr:S1 RNA-binding domain-containing protein [Anaerolineales bacterium]MCB8923504.1 S1 RNA-binding domain-containing protein [Ardenticatenaceae bacterium]MCB9003771.1 S1 RNA-binding domain-containing protein [Ardenticatenaceae bacterium]
MSDELTELTDAPEIAVPSSIEELKPKMQVKGRVERLELYGAFMDIGVGVNALIHISQLSEGRVNRVSDALKEGDEVLVWIDKVDPQAQQIMVTMIEPVAVDWSDLKTGNMYTGKIVRLENFGAFVDIGAEREGLVHISELSHDYVKNPSEVVKVGDEVEVQVLGFSKRKRRIDLSMKALMEKPEPTPEEFSAPVERDGGGSRRRGRASRVEQVDFDFDDEEEALPTAMEVALRRAMGDDAIDEMADSKKKGKKSRRRRERRREQQEDLLNRTLQLQD